MITVHMAHNAVSGSPKGAKLPANYKAALQFGWADQCAWDQAINCLSESLEPLGEKTESIVQQ